MAARGSIRVRCAECRKISIKEGYCIKLAKEIRCKHKVTFQAIYPDIDGKDITKSCPTFDDAQKELRGIGSQMDTGIYKKIQPEKLKEIALDYLLSHRGNLRPNTYSVYRYHVEAIIRAFGEFPINKITFKMLSDFMESYTHQSFYQRQKIQCRLKGIFKYAEFQGHLKENPTRWLKPVRNVKKRTTYNGLNLGRIPELLGMIKDPTANFYCRWAFFTGMRPNEICGLSRASIDMDKKVFKVEQVLNYYSTQEERGSDKNSFGIYDCKTGAGFRVLPIGPELYEHLQIYLIKAPENRHNLLFARPDGMPIHHRRHIILPHYMPALKILHRRTEFPVMDFYDLTRHTFASMLFSMKPAIGHKKIQYLMGHEDYHTTANIYARLFGKDISEDDDFNAVATNMESLVRESVPTL